MESTQEAQDALFALFAVKLDFVSEAVVERVLAKREGTEPLRCCLVNSGKLTNAQALTIERQLDPQVISGFHIEGEAGRGGMGVVFRARQISMDRLVAVKVLARRLSQDESYVAKFLDEARAAAKLNHENIVAAIDAGESNGLHYFVMEFVDGQSVADLLDAQGRIPTPRTLEIAEQMARALEHAHNARIVHRDVKPENIMFSGDGAAKLCDLGLAKPLQEAGTGEKSSMTEGTPYYCSPEQARGRTDIDSKSDVYSLGCTIYHMLTGEPPFDGDTPRSILLKQVQAPFPNLDQALPDVPPALRQLIGRMVVKDREKRIALREFEEQLVGVRRELSGRQKQAPRASGQQAPGLPLPVLGAAAGVILLIIVVALAMGGGSGEDPGSADTKTEETTRTEQTRDPEKTPKKTTPHNGGSKLSQAGYLYKEAQVWERDNPADIGGAIARYRKITDLHPDTHFADKARVRVRALEDQLTDRSDVALRELGRQVDSLLDESNYAGAKDLIDTFRLTWSSRNIPGLDQRLRGLRLAISSRAEAKLETALRTFEENGSETARSRVEALLPHISPTAADRARRRLTGRMELKARKRWEIVRSLVNQAVARLDMREARRLLSEARNNPLFAPLQAEIKRASDDVGGLERATKAFQSNLARATRGSIQLRLASGKVVKGRVRKLDMKNLKLELVVDSARDVEVVRLADVSGKQLASYGLAAREARYSALHFAAIGLPLASTAALDSYVAAGGADDPQLRTRIKSLDAKRSEADARARIEPLLTAGADPKTVLKGITSLPDSLRATATYKARFAQLKEAYTRARMAEIAKDERRMFRGSFKKTRKGKVTLEYDFASKDQANDWLADTAVNSKSKVSWKPGALTVLGKATHQARFEGGALKIEARVLVKSVRRPNANFIISDSGPWQGILCGAGFKYGNIRNIKIDASARKKASYVIDLPAHVLIILKGSPPSRRMPQVLAAEEKPAVKGSTLKITIQRDRKGLVRFKVGSSLAYRAGPVPLWDAPGKVSLIPFDSQVTLKEFTVSGKIDAEWLKGYARTVAAAEANRLPAPIN